MSNRATIDGSNNIVIQNADNTQITIHTSDHDALVAELKQLNQEQIVAIKKLTNEQVLPQQIEQLLGRYLPNRAIPKQLTSLVRLSKGDIIGREVDLTTLRQRLSRENRLLLVNGMGELEKQLSPPCTWTFISRLMTILPGLQLRIL